MKSIVLAITLTFALFSNVAQAMCVGSYMGNTFVLPGSCLLYSNWQEADGIQGAGAFDCMDLPGSPFYPSNPPNNLGGTSSDGIQINYMDGSIGTAASDKTIKNIRKVKEPSKLTLKEFSKLIKKGKTSQRNAHKMAETMGTKYIRVSERLRHKGRALDSNDTCIDDIYNKRKDVWKKIGLAPLSVFTGGLVGAGAGAGGAYMAIKGTLLSADLVKRLGMATFVTQGALYGTAIGAIGAGAYVLGKSIYHGVQLIQNAKMIDLVSQARMPQRYGRTKKFKKFARKMLGKKRKESINESDFDFVSRTISELDQSGRLCGKGDVTSYRKLKKHLKKRGKEYKKYKGKQETVSCSIGTNADGEQGISCKAKERGNISKCKSNLRTMSDGQSLHFSKAKDGTCSLSSERPSGVPTVTLKMNKGELIPIMASMPKGTTSFEFRVKSKNKTRVLKTRIEINEGAKSSTQTCLATEMDGSKEGEVTHLTRSLDRKFHTVATTVSTARCSSTTNSDGSGTIEMVMKVKEKANKSNCKSNITYSGSRTSNASVEILDTRKGANESCAISTKIMSGSGDDKVSTEFRHEAKIMEKNPQTGKEIQITAETAIIDHRGVPGGTILQSAICTTIKKSSSNGESTHSCESSGNGYSSSCSLKKGGDPSKVKTQVEVEKEI